MKPFQASHSTTITFFRPYQKPRLLFRLASRHSDINKTDFSEKLATSASTFSRHCFPDIPPYLRDVIFFRSSLPRWQLAVAKISWLTFPTVSASITAQGAASVHTRLQRPPKVWHRNEKLERVLLRKSVSRPRPGDFKASRLLDVTKHATKQRVWRFLHPVQPFIVADVPTLVTSNVAWSPRPTMWYKSRNPVIFPLRMLVALKFYDYTGKKKVVRRAPERVWYCSAINFITTSSQIKW